MAKEVYTYEFDAVGNWTKMTTSVAVMEGGKVRLTGTAAEVRDHPEMATLYLGGSAAAAS